MKLKIAHTTSYSYDKPVSYALQQLRLTPVDSSQQKVLNWNVVVEGGKKELSFSDQHGNQTILVSVDKGQNGVRVTAEGEIDTIDTAGIVGKVYGNVPLWHFLQVTPRTRAGKAISKLAGIINRGETRLNGLHELSKSILEIVPYGAGSTQANTTAEEALATGGGVCQDHAQIFIAAARKAGIPARYVSGYLMMNNHENMDASHAWAEAHLDDLGWVGFDISNGISPDERYVKLATGLDYSQAAPISGLRMGSANESMIVSLQIQQ